MPAVKTERKAKDVMTPDPVCVFPSTTVAELGGILDGHHISGAPVVDSQGRLLGLISHHDLFHACADPSLEVSPSCIFELLRDSGEEPGFRRPSFANSVRVRGFMTKDVLTVSPEVPAEAVARLMSENRAHRVIVVDEDRSPVGIITSLDLLAHLASSPG